MSTIPANAVVNVGPSVLAAGGSALDLNGLILTTSARVPIGTVMAFSSPAAVATFFGGASRQAAMAATYFAGFDGANKTPGSLLFAQFPKAAVAAYARGANVSGLTLTQLQAISGTLSVTIDNVLKTASINLSAATSLSNAAQIIEGTLGVEGPLAATFTGAIAGTTLTVSAVASGTIAPGQTVDGAGIAAANTFVVAQLTGTTGGVGTYTVSQSQTVASEAMTSRQPGVTYDSTSGAFSISSGTTGPTSTINFPSGAVATSLFLTQASGAVLSQGAAAAVPGAFMTALTMVTQNWAAFATAFDPDSGSGNALKVAFAAWNSQQNNRYGYACWDADPTPAISVPATGSLGYLLAQSNYSGTIPIWAPSEDIGVIKAAFVLAIGASIDFNQLNGRATYKFRAQAGLIADVTDQQTASNLGGVPAVSGDRGNGYNFYGAYASANSLFTFFANGFVSGPFLWADSYVNQIWLNNSFQAALLSYLTQVKSVAYNAAGRAAIEAAVNGVINAGLAFGAYRPGVTLSSSQVSQVNAAAGREIASTLQQRGWYLLVGDANPVVRQNRGTPPCTFFYVDGQSVQYINLASVALQ